MEIVSSVNFVYNDSGELPLENIKVLPIMRHTPLEIGFQIQKYSRSKTYYMICFAMDWVICNNQ